MIDHIQTMTDEQLKDMLERITEELDEREWNRILAQPQQAQRATEMARKARQQYRDRKTVEGGFGKDE